MKFVKNFSQLFENVISREHVLTFIDKLHFDGTEGPRKFPDIDFSNVKDEIEKYVNSGIEGGKLYNGEELLDVLIKIVPAVKKYTNQIVK